MIRYTAGNGVNLGTVKNFKKDVKQGLIKVVNFEDKKKHITGKEYWIYRYKETKTGLWGLKNKPLIKKSKTPLLYCIIICDNDRMKLFKETGQLFIEGVKITGTDINDYLRKTKRSTVDNWYIEDYEKPKKEKDMKTVSVDDEE